MALSAAADSHDRREIKRAPVALANVSTSGVFEGYASLFDTADLGRDVVARGAFAHSLLRRGPAGVKMLWQHEASEPIGTWLAIKEDSRGLKVHGRLNLAVARAREILALMREGAVDGLSIGFRTRKAVTDRKTGLRTLQSVDLWEISVVTFPMHPGARVTAVKRMRSADLSLAGVRCDLTRLRWGRDALALERVLRRLERRYSDDQPRDEQGRWTSGGGGSDTPSSATPVGLKPGNVPDGGSSATPAMISCEHLMDSDLAICKSAVFEDDKNLLKLCMINVFVRNKECLRGLPLTPLLPY